MRDSGTLRGEVTAASASTRSASKAGSLSPDRDQADVSRAYFAGMPMPRIDLAQSRSKHLPLDWHMILRREPPDPLDLRRIAHPYLDAIVDVNKVLTATT